MKKLILLVTLLLLPSICLASPPSRSYSYVSGASISPTEVTTNEDNIYTYLNAGVDTYSANSITGTALISSLAITSSGNMTFSGTTNISGTLQLGGTAITSSAAELNLIDGLTSSASELNILDGATLTTAELNYVDNVTSAIQTQLDGKSATTGNALIVTLGTITTGGWAGTAIPVAYGGTGSTTASTARTALGLAIGTDVQAYNSNLTAINQALTTTSSPSFTTVTANLTGNVTGNVTGSSGSCTGNATTATTAAGLSATLAVASGGTGLTSLATFLMTTDTRFQTGATTRNLETADGTQAVTGVGFAPKAVMFMTANQAGLQFSIGFDDISTPKMIYSTATTYTGNTKSCGVEISAGNSNFGYISATGADGFTITWAKTGSPTGTVNIIYIAFK